MKLRRLGRLNPGRTEVSCLYRNLLKDLPLILPAESTRGKHVWHRFTVRSGKRDALRAALDEAGIASMIYYPVPLHRQPLYAADCAGLELPVTDEAARTVLSLPIFPHLGEQRARRVCEALRAAL